MPAVRPAVRVLVADARSLGTDLERALEGDPELQCVGRVELPSEVVAEARRLRPEVVLLGHGFGGGTTLQVVADLVADGLGLRVLVLSEVGSEMFARETLRRGAAGFLVHSGDLRTLLPRIRASIGRAPAEGVPA
jgi:DNA-binding NarL/FixJ family response regulator